MKFKFLTESMLTLLQDFHLDNNEILTESREDELRLIDFAGEPLAKRYLAIRNRMKLPQNDMYYWINNRTPAELEQAVTDMENTPTRAQLKHNAGAGAKLVAENDFWRVYNITTYEASQRYGRDTQWCITGIKDYGRKYWDDYTNAGITFYFFIAKNNYDARGRFSKYAVAVTPEKSLVDCPYKVYDQQDNEVYGVPNAPLIEGVPDVRAVDTDYFIYDGSDIPDNLNRQAIHTLEIADTVTEIPYVELYDFSSIEEVEVPGSVEIINVCAFRKCTSLKTVRLNPGVQQIEELAFYECPNIEEVYIPASVTEINKNAFHGCSKLNIHCPSGSFAETFAKNNNIPCVLTECVNKKIRLI